MTNLGSVTFVGAGPGEFGLLTLLGARALHFADLIIIDADADEAELRRLDVGHARIEHVADDELTQILDATRDGAKVVRLGYSDQFLEFHETDVLPRVQDAGVRINVIPGLSHWATMLNYGAIRVGRSIALLEAHDQAPPPSEWPSAGTVAIHVEAEFVDDVCAVGASQYGEDSPVLVLTKVGTTDQTSQLLTWETVEAPDSCSCYLVFGEGIADAKREETAWYESKPLFDWRVLSPRTKDDLEPLIEELAQYGAVTETMRTMSIEPPRTEQGMERAMRRLVDGHYLWCVFTSPYAVAAVAERLDEYGLDSRALSGISIAAVGNGTADALRRRGIRADLVPHDSNTAGGLALEFPAFDDMMDPLDRVLIPTADVAVDKLVEGMEGLGWEVEPVIAYRTVRAAPPPAEVRDDIKQGMFDAVAFTSASSVRNMIGIAGKPHQSTVIAAIGEATAAACEQHGLRVDAIADSPTYASLAEALARFADRRRADQLAKGEPVKKPSERKRRRRRKPVDRTA